MRQSLPFSIVTEAIERYKAGEHATHIAKSLNITYASIYYYLVKLNIPIHPKEFRGRKYECNQNFFKNIQDENVIYWAGFIAGDGGVAKNQLTLRLSNKDYDHLIKYNKSLESNYLVKPYDENNSFVCITSPIIVNDLKSIWGIVPNKSLILEWPKILAYTDINSRHFLRGLTDADGSFGSTQFIYGLRGTEQILQNAQKVLMYYCWLDKTKISLSSGIYKLQYSGRVQVARIHKFLYEDSTIYLDRKYQSMLSHWQ